MGVEDEYRMLEEHQLSTVKKEDTGPGSITGASQTRYLYPEEPPVKG
ncbi:MAG: hypothetical protein ABEJ83_05825 [Candidatus Nanohaloarchaea archaeon]